MSMVGHPCTIRGCTGTYRSKSISQLDEAGRNRVVIEGIPAEVCDRCGDVLLSPEAVRGIEEARKRAPLSEPVGSVPVYRFQPPAPAA